MDIDDVRVDVSSNDTQDIKSKDEKRIRKKFAVPPVKVACLECASRTRCDGGKPECLNCRQRHKSCVYTQSKRGGARIRRKALDRKSEANNNELNHCPLSILPELDEASFTGPLSLVAPGGGLKQLDLSFDDIDFVVDCSFVGNDVVEDEYPISDHTPSEDLPLYPIRVYSSDEDILNAYYIYIHPYFPVLPPPEPHNVNDNPDFGVQPGPDSLYTSARAPNFSPSSPISLAISATLALIPHPSDPDPAGTKSTLARRSQAQVYAHSAYENIEYESELLDSVLCPGEALSNEVVAPVREPFHPKVPVENETVIALLLLGTYEYAQRGNISKLRNRAGQALTAAMSLGLHENEDGGIYAEANRRTWWMTYIIVCQAGILSNSSPSILLYDPRFTTPEPTFKADTESWSLFLQSQQAIITATQFVIDLDATSRAKANPALLWDRMLALDATLEPLLAQAEAWALESASFPPVALDESELQVSQALRGMARIKLNSARIKLHRYCAFSDIPIFTKKHCDLHPITASSPKPPPSESNCSCNSLPSVGTPYLSSPLSVGTSSSTSSPLPVNQNSLPFTPHASAKICLASSLSIADAFRSLPYPQPHAVPDWSSSVLTQLPNVRSPRTIPVFACCAMQASYALIMISYKTKAMGFMGSGGSAEKLLIKLTDALGMILDALRNYAGAFEAVGGMRDQIELAM